MRPSGSHPSGALILKILIGRVSHLDEVADRRRSSRVAGWSTLSMATNSSYRGTARCNSGQSATRVSIGLGHKTLIDIYGGVIDAVTAAPLPAIARDQQLGPTSVKHGGYNCSICDFPTGSSRASRTRQRRRRVAGKCPFARLLQASPHRAPGSYWPAFLSIFRRKLGAAPTKVLF